MDGFSHVFPMTVRARDIDAWGHVNNAVYFTYLESARIDYLRRVVFPDAGSDLVDMSTILAEVMCQYRKPIFFGQAVEIGTRITVIGNTSIKLEHQINADRELAATATAVWVYYDYQAGQSVRVPDEFRRRVQAFAAMKKTTD